METILEMLQESSEFLIMIWIMGCMAGMGVVKERRKKKSKIQWERLDLI